MVPVPFVESFSYGTTVPESSRVFYIHEQSPHLVAWHLNVDEPLRPLGDRLWGMLSAEGQRLLKAGAHEKDWRR